MQRTGSVSRWLYAALGMLLIGAALLLAAEADPAARTRLIRYWSLLAAAVFAVAAPHVLLPDTERPLVQLLNRPPPALLVRQLRAWGPMVGLFVAPCLLLAFYDPGAFGDRLGFKAAHGLSGVLLVMGSGLYSLDRYSVIGPVSQAWQEGRRGQRFRRAMDHSTTGPAVPYGAIPALTATGRIFLVAALYVVGSAAVTLLGSAWLAVLPGLVLLGWTGAKLRRRAPTYDRFYYHTDAFYSELFRQGGGVRGAAREPLPYGAVYWVPRWWRPSVWASLRQLDRRLPLGRFIVLGHLFLWMLFYQGVGAGITAAYVLLFSAAKNAASLLLTADALAPSPFQLWLQRPGDWFITRFFVNLRWTLPLLLSLLLVALFDRTFTYGTALAWTAADLGLAALGAGAATWLHERRYLKRYA